MSRLGFTLKEIFTDIDGSEIQFLNKHLKRYMSLHKEVMLPKRTIKGERFVSNQWDFALFGVVCALLSGFREIKNQQNQKGFGYENIEELVDLQIDYPFKKGWGFGMPYFNGAWEFFADQKRQGFCCFLINLIESLEKIIEQKDK